MTDREWDFELSDDESDNETPPTDGSSDISGSEMQQNSRAKKSDLAKKLTGRGVSGNDSVATNDEFGEIVEADEEEDDDDFNPMD
jgi:hypothetical protein